MGLNFEDSDTTSPGTGHHLRRVARTTPPRPGLETRTLPPRLRDKRSGGGGGPRKYHFLPARQVNIFLYRI